jgi:hypothetical protein
MNPGVSQSGFSGNAGEKAVPVSKTKIDFVYFDRIFACNAAPVVDRFARVFSRRIQEMLTRLVDAEQRTRIPRMVPKWMAENGGKANDVADALCLLRAGHCKKLQ